MKKVYFIFFLTFVFLIFFKTSIVLSDPKMEIGIDIFKNKAQCGACHIMKSAQSAGNIGPNLDTLKPSMDQIIYVVTNGIGVMQSWEGILTKEEIEAVAYYVFSNTNK